MVVRASHWTQPRASRLQSTSHRVPVRSTVKTIIPFTLWSSKWAFLVLPFVVLRFLTALLINSVHQLNLEVVMRLYALLRIFLYSVLDFIILRVQWVKKSSLSSADYSA